MRCDVYLTCFLCFLTSTWRCRSLFCRQVWIGQSTLAGNQVWGGEQSNFLEDWGQYWEDHNQD
jgi:hypothetical protein